MLISQITYLGRIEIKCDKFLVAGVGFEPTTFRLGDLSRKSIIKLLKKLLVA